MPTESYGHAESPSLDAELALTDSKTESDEEAPEIHAGDQDEGQAGPNPGEQDEGQAGPNLVEQDEGHVRSNPEDTDVSTHQIPDQMDEEFTSTAYPNVQENLKLPTEDQVILEEPASSTGTLSSLQNLDKKLSFTNQFFIKKPQEKEPKKTNTQSEVQSMVTVPIHHDTSSVPPITSSVIDLIVSHPFQMEECHKMLTDQVDWTNPEGEQVRVDVNRPLPLGGPPGHVTIQLQFFFNKDLEYLRYGSKGSMQNMASLTGGLLDRSSILTDMILRHVAKMLEHTMQISQLTFEDLNLLLLQGHLDHLPGSDKRMLSTAVKLWTRNLVIRQRVKDFQLGIESYQTQLNLTKPGWDATGYEFKHDYTIIESPRAVVFPVNNNERKIMRFNKIYKFSDGTLTRILEALDYRVKEFKVKRLNPGMNTRFWTQKDVTRSKEFIAAIEKRLKTRRIYRNLECFVGGRVRDIDYRLLQRTE
ncbi:hypothetical protein Tco_0111645 [Tanacetum coccineum]